MMSRRSFLAMFPAPFIASTAPAQASTDMDTYTAEMARLRAPLSTSPKIEDFIRYATLAANGHNTQPWRFQITANGVTILPDHTRRTAVVDPDDHHLFVSLGCAAENFLIAADNHGRHGELNAEAPDTAGLEITLGNSQAKPTQLYDAIPFRQSTRSLYDGQALTTQDMKLLETAARQEGVACHFITEPSQMERATDFVTRGNSSQLNDPAFVNELKDWIRFNPQHALDTNDGLFAACSGNPTSPTWIGKRIFKWVLREGTENTKYSEQIRSSAGIAVFVGNKDDPAHWVKVGQSFERFALQATALGIRTAHLNQPTEVLELRAEFAAAMGLGDQRPNLVIRFGRADALPMSPRRPVSEVLVSSS